MNENIETLKKRVTDLKNTVWNDDVKKQVSELRKSVKDPEFRAKVVENLKKTGTTAQEVALDLIRQGKNSQYFDQYVMAVVESPKTETALKKLNETLGSPKALAIVEAYRVALIDQKITKAKTAATPEEATVETEPKDTEVEEKRATRKSPSHKKSEK